MLNLPSSGLFGARVETRAEARRNSRRDVTVARFTLVTLGLTAGATRVESVGEAEGTTGTAMLGGGGDGVLAALPMPLGSLTELLRPPALPGPGGMPLTPASPAIWAKDSTGAVKLAARARAKNADLPNMITLRGESA